MKSLTRRIIFVSDENFAREVMQLFTIGLDELNLDGTLKSNNGEPIPTYDIDTVKAVCTCIYWLEFLWHHGSELV